MFPSFYASLVRRRPGISAILGCLVFVWLAAAIQRGNIKQSLAYLAAVAISVVAIDAMSHLRQLSPKPLPVRDPRLESMVLIVFGLIALAWLTSRFVFNYRPEAG